MEKTAMVLIVAIPKETITDEHRVAATPEIVKKMIAMGCEVRIESGAGEGAAVSNVLFAESGAIICNNFVDTARGAHIILCVQPPKLLTGIEKGALLIGIF
jgi:NAD(P) transhydrogenase subunit alpha